MPLVKSAKKKEHGQKRIQNNRLLSSGRPLRRPRTVGAVRAIGTVGAVGAMGRSWARAVMMVMDVPMIIPPVASVTDIDAVVYRGRITG